MRSINSQDPNTAYNNFTSIYESIYEKCFPYVTVKHKKAKLNSKPWITKGLFQSIKTKSKLYKAYLHLPSDSNHKKYKLYNNKLTNLLKISKKLYYDSKLEKARGNLKMTWKLLNGIMNKNNKSILPSIFNHNGKEISDPDTIANKFCDFFTNIGPSLANKLPHSEVSFTSFLKNRISESIFLRPVTEDEIIHLVSNFKNGTASGFDGFTMSDIKPNIAFLARPLSHLLNLSISLGKVPDKVKIARVIPIYKNDCPSNFNNYRPISVLPAFSKIYEKVIFERLVSFIEKHSILYEHQYGFRSQHSTVQAILHLVDQISTSIDNKEICTGIFLDLSKAFDTVNHNILLNKLEHYGIRGLAINWMTSYLTDRKQFVEYNSRHSEWKTVKCGIPQGSILGPLLFILYINDISNSSTLLKFILFADDTSAFYSSKDINNCDLINNELDKVYNWLISNQLSVNITKTKNIVFRSKQKRINLSNYHLRIDNKIIERKEHFKFLGVIIDEHLTWKEHINTVAGKISRSIGIISKIQFYVSQSSLLNLYYSLIYPYLYYGNIVWGATYKSNLKRLIVLQKRIIRIITKSKYDAHTAPLFHNLNLLNLENIYTLQIGLFMFSVLKNNSIPKSFKSLFSQSSSFHSYSTRHNKDLRPHQSRTNVKKFTFTCQGPRIWNSFPEDLKSKPTMACFKSCLKKYLLTSYC